MQDNAIEEYRRVIAELRQERDAALARETALADVLDVINRSPGDPGPVFEAILEKAHRLCGADAGALMRYDGECFHAVATHGLPDEFAALVRRPFRGASHQRLIDGERIVHVADAKAIPSWRVLGEVERAFVERTNLRASLFVPLRKDDALLGFISADRNEARSFSENEIALLENFAAQAVIAIENARLITEALEQQIATAEVLQVINASPGNLTPVFDAMLEKAMRLCGATIGGIYRYNGQRFDTVALRGVTPGFAAFSAENPMSTIPGGPPWVVLETKRPVQVVDIAATDRYRDGTSVYGRALVDIGGIRAVLNVPLLNDGAVLGLITIYRAEPGAFSDKQIALLENFAAQAVIAMENARLINEQREALEQQTATAEVLQVINASPGNLTPVFDTILEKAMRLCGAAFGSLYTYDGEHFHSAAQRGVPPAYAEFRAKNPPVARSGSAIEQAIETKRTVHRLDVMWSENYQSGNPFARAMVELGGIRTDISVPLLKDQTVIGFIQIYRQEVRAFSEKEIALLENFAAQAVIAMQSARLIAEQREALEQQTATTEVLQVINASPGNLAPVFDTILDKAMRLCGGTIGGIFMFDGDHSITSALRGVTSAFKAYNEKNPMDKIQPGTLPARIIETRGPVQNSDRTAGENYRVGHPYARALVELGGIRAVLAVPLLEDGAAVGMVVIYREEAGAFSEKQIALLENFAAQAVIAMENARLLTALRQRTDELARRNNEYGERIEHQSATIDVLQAMSASPGNAQPVFDLITRRAKEVCNAPAVMLFEYDGKLVHFRSECGSGSGATPGALEAYKRLFPMAPTRALISCRAILERQIIEIRDMTNEPDLPEVARGLGHRSNLAVPLLRDGAAIGAIGIISWDAGGFPDSQVELMKTFAEQAVIAISSAETFKELQRRTMDLTRSVAELQALEEVLRAVNSSLELETVLSTIISRAVQLSEADEGTIYEYDVSEQVFVPKSAFGMSAERVAALRERRIKLGETHLGRSAILRAPVYVEDVQQDPSIPNAGDVLPGIHAVLAVPLLRNDTVIGGLVIRRRTEEGFAETIVTLMQTFSGQAVLAIENARLFQEAGRARTAAEAALVDLRRAQDRLVQSE